MKALISPIEEICISEDSNEKIALRIAEIVQDDKIFPVCEPLFWVDCPNDCNANDWCYYEGSFIKKPDPPFAEEIDKI